MLVALPGRPLAQDIVSIQGDPAARAETRERLFHALKAAPSKLVAQQITARIWQFWFEAPDADSARLMSDALKRRQSRDFAGAISVLDQLVAQASDWAEAWNQRATLRFMVGDLQGSLADIDQVLPLEPKHFGALSGEAMILRRLGQQDKAQSVLKRAVKINPFLSDRVLLKPEPEGEDI
jgi:Tfp pilus assembly protein PilF